MSLDRTSLLCMYSYDFRLLNRRGHVPADSRDSVHFAHHSEVLLCNNVRCVILFSSFLFYLQRPCTSHTSIPIEISIRNVSLRLDFETWSCFVHRNASTNFRLPFRSVFPHLRSGIYCTIALIAYKRLNNTFLNTASYFSPTFTTI